MTKAEVEGEVEHLRHILLKQKSLGVSVPITTQFADPPRERRKKITVLLAVGQGNNPVRYRVPGPQHHQLT